MDNISNKSISRISEYALSNAGDLEIARFIDKLVAKVGSREGFEHLCLEANLDPLLVSNNGLELFFDDFLDLFWKFIKSSPAGHGMSHLIQDSLTAMALYNDAFVEKKSDYILSFSKDYIHKSEFWAGIIGGILHDIGNSLVPRYTDYHRRCGHAEVAAWIVYKMLEQYSEEEFRLLCAYAVAAHTHYRKPIVIEGKGIYGNNHEGNYHRPVYWYEDYVPGSGKWLSISVVMVRAIDRLGTRGVTHLARHLIATADSVQVGVTGSDHLDGFQTHTVDEEALRIHLLPRLGYYQIEGRDGKTPTVLQDVLNFQGGDLGKNNSVYGRNDGYLGVYRDLMIDKHCQTSKLTRGIVELEPSMLNFSRMTALIQLKDMLSMVSRSVTFNEAWETLYPLINELNDTQLARWQNGALIAKNEYSLQMQKFLRLATADASNPMQPLYSKIVPHSF